jgi:hypothetical protein
VDNLSFDLNACQHLDGSNYVALAFLPAGRQVLPTDSFFAPNKWGRYNLNLSLNLW